MIRVLADYVRKGWEVRTIAEMEGFRVALTDGEFLFMSKSQKKLFDLETGNQRRNFLLQCPVVRIDGPIEEVLPTLDTDGRLKT